jgi:two-component system cell cycle sensor histidine kinase/response regulator CckA
LKVESTSAAATLGPQEASFLALAESLSSLIALIEGDTLRYVNPAGCALLGRPRELLVGRSVWELFHPDDRGGAMARGRARQAGISERERLTGRLVHADGRTIWMDYSTDLIQLDGRPRTLVTGSDVTERERIDEERRKSEARLAEAQRIAHVGSWEWDVAGDRIVWSDELCRIYGIDPAAFGGTLEGYLELVHPDDRAMAREVMNEALRRGGPFAFEHRVVFGDGSVRTMIGKGEVFVDASGTPVRVAGTAQDITDRKRMEVELRKSEERLRLAFTNAAIGKGILALDRRILQVNPAACRMFGYTEAELLSRTTRDITHPDDLSKSDELARRLLDGGEDSGSIEKRFLHKDGRTVWVSGITSVVRDPDGKPLYFIIEAQDITEHKRAEEALQESEERFRNLCTQAPVMLMAFDPSGRVRDVSNYWLQTMGYERGEVVGREGWDFITPDSQARLRKVIEANQRRKASVIKNLPIRAVRKDGTTVDLLITSVAQVSDTGEYRGSICVSINLTDLRRAEEALRESEERYRALVEHSPDAIMVLDAEKGLFVDANAHAERLFGYPREQLLMMGPLDFCRQHQANGCPSWKVAEDETRKVLEGETSVFEFTHVDAAGREIACQTRLSRLPAVGRKLIRVTITDITELKQLQEKVRHAEKMAAVGVLAAGVAHEIGNPLMALSMAAQSLERRTSDDYAQKKLALIREHIDRISRIVRQMSDLARPRSRRRADCDLNQVVRRAVEMVRYDSRSKNSEIRYELAEGLPHVEAVEDELTQVCINLALNAFDAMAANPPDRPRLLTIRSDASASVVRVSFRDTGPGVPREVRSKLFQPFFTTKQVGKGTGLGLSLSYRILQEHQGTLRLDEDAGPGASFVFELPRRGKP